MTRDDIIRMAIKAGLLPSAEIYEDDLERFAALVAAFEREECAKVAAATVCDTHLPTGFRIYGTRAADAIRAMGKA